MSTRQARSRGWCFTINNPTEPDRIQVIQLQNYARYYIRGLERGTDRGTLHYQGYVYFQHAVTMQRVKQLLPRAHLEPQRGTCNQAIEYCKKDGDFEEWGDAPDLGGGKTQREKWIRLIELSERGELDRLRDEFPGEYFRYHERIRSLRIRESRILQGELEHEWWVGPSGSGKSRRLWTEYPDHFAKELNKWWDGYRDEEVVAIEEWSPKNECTASFLKVWADRYPFPAQIKGGCLKKIRPRKIIVLSNYTIDQCFEREEDRGPIKRRFKVVNFDTHAFNPTLNPRFVLRSQEEEEKEDELTQLLELIH